MNYQKTEFSNARLSIRFEIGRDILKVDGMFYFIYFFLNAFLITLYIMTTVFFTYFHQFPAAKNVQIAINSEQ